MFWLCTLKKTNTSLKSDNGKEDGISHSSLTDVIGGKLRIYTLHSGHPLLSLGTLKGSSHFWQKLVCQVCLIWSVSWSLFIHPKWTNDALSHSCEPKVGGNFQSNLGLSLRMYISTLLSITAQTCDIQIILSFDFSKGTVSFINDI